jgi:uncharacterized protein (DUF433 family)
MKMDPAYTHEAVRDICAGYSDEDLDQLIEAWLEVNPAKPTRTEVRTRIGAVPVWAIIGNLESHGNDTVDLAAAYDIPHDAVRAALAYYQRHASVIDARIEANTIEIESVLE